MVELAGGWPNGFDVPAGAAVLGAADVLAGVDAFKLPKKGFEVGAEVEAEVGGTVGVAPPERLANRLEATGAAEVVAPPNNGAELVAGAALVVGAWVPGVLAVG